MYICALHTYMMQVASTGKLEPDLQLQVDDRKHIQHILSIAWGRVINASTVFGEACSDQASAGAQFQLRDIAKGAKTQSCHRGRWWRCGQVCKDILLRSTGQGRGGEAAGEVAGSEGALRLMTSAKGVT